MLSESYLIQIVGAWELNVLYDIIINESCFNEVRLYILNTYICTYLKNE